MAQLFDTNSTTLVGSESDQKYRKAKTAEKALQEIQTENFANTTRAYYSKRENDKSYLTYSHADILEKFYNDRSWRTNNTVAMGFDLSNVMSADAETLKQFNYINQTYAELPSFWDDPNRSFGAWLLDNGSAVIADPINLIGFGIGGQAAKQGYKMALKEALKGKIAKEISEQAIKQAAKEAEKKALGKALKKGAIYEGVIGASATTIQDTLLQTTAIKSGVQDERDLIQTVRATATGGVFGTVFGAAFTGIGFKLTNRHLKNTSIKNLKDLHEYGRSNITGKRLYDDLSSPKEKQAYYKNLTKDEIDAIENKSIIAGRTLDEKLENIHKTIDGNSKPPKEQLNYTKYTPRANAAYLKSLVDDAVANNSLDTEVISNRQAIDLSKTLNEPIDEILKWSKTRSKEGKLDFVRLLIFGDHIAKQADDQLKLSHLLTKAVNEGDEVAARKIEAKMDLMERVTTDSLITYKNISKAAARTTQIGRVDKDARRANELINAPENPELIKLKENSPREFKLALAKLDDQNQVIIALQNARKVEGWDLATEYINNNLLSSPDTHILNIVSGLVQTQWKPFVMLLRAANLGLSDSKRAKELGIEAFDTYIHQYIYTAHAIRQFGKSFYAGHGILDSKAMKYDNSMRQGQLQAWVKAMGSLMTRPLGKVGGVIQHALVNPIAYGTTVPMRFLSAGDEFLKTISFRARRTSQIHSQLRKENDTSLWSGYFKDKDAKQAYEKRFKEIEAEYMDTNGVVAKTTVGSNSSSIQDVNKNEVNDPLQYAREATYTQSSLSTNPETGKQEGGATAAILSWTSKNKWSRALGLHFINTPSNLIKWNFEQLPVLRKLVVSTRHALMKGKNKKYLNPEAAAEANARMQGGMLLWYAAYSSVIAGKITSGGSRDWRVNKERTASTGWQPYSYKTDDGRYIKLSRLDPIMTPFFMMADIMETINNFTSINEDLPSEAENTLTELSMGVVAALTQNLTSKFYMKGIIETASFMLGDEAMKSKAPDRIGTSIFARALYKVFPLSGGLRYGSRVDADVQQELWTLSDRLKQLDPFEWVSDKHTIMPQRNMFGEPINRQNGWLFGLGEKSGLWSSPFAMTEWSNPAIGKFFQDRDFDFRKPSPIDRKSKIDLRTIVNNATKQTAYDRWRELTGEVKLTYKGKKYNLKGYIEALILDPKSLIYYKPDGKVGGDDLQQKEILKIINKAQKLAKTKMMQEFPIVQKTQIERNQFKYLKIQEQSIKRKSLIDSLIN